ncbi:phage/plasmid primase, P4 family [Anaerotignum sp.]|uniref:phage/plasmid primase, P4 family n=1 Tax=Anaerotignum sp. TaxID=2039241 RepID=UPI0039934244
MATELFQNIPEEMKNTPHWIMWRLIDKGGKKPAKVPFSVNGDPAKVNSPDTWSDFQSAVNAYKSGQFQGVGFVFTDTPFVGIDIDGCIDLKTGEISQGASEIIEMAKSYTELSQSGSGFHIILRGELPQGRKRKGSFEMYGNGSPRYFAMTGNRWGAYTTIRESQNDINAIHQKYIADQKQDKANGQKPASLTDAQVIQTATAARNGGAFYALYKGDWSGKYNSQSEADIAFCNMLAFWTGRNQEQMDNIFRSSGLMRDKWDEIRGGHTYGEITIIRACDGCETVYEPAYQTSRPVTAAGAGSLDRFHKFNNKGRPTGIYDFLVVEHLLQTEHIFVIGQTPYIYENGVYDGNLAEYTIKDKIQKLLYMEVCTARNIGSIYKLLIDQKQLQKKYDEINTYPSYWINFKNGMLNPKTKELLPHDPKYFSINQIPWVYDPEKAAADYPASAHFLNTSFYAEDIKTVFQFLGLCMTVETNFQYFFTLIGEGGNGKSILISLFEKIIGRNNVSSVALQELSQRFQGTRLFGKLLNSCADIPMGALEDDSVIKKITGGDSVTREHKGKDATEFLPYAKYLFSANRFPYVGDKSDGFMRRLRIVVMDKKPKEIDIHLKEKLLNELDFWILQGVAGLRELLETNTLFESKKSTEKRLNIEKKNNTVVSFIEDCICTCENHNIKRADVYREYVAYCSDQGRSPSGKSVFFEEMETKGYAVSLLKGNYIYRNIAFSVWRDEEYADGYTVFGM